MLVVASGYYRELRRFIDISDPIVVTNGQCHKNPTNPIIKNLSYQDYHHPSPSTSITINNPKHIGYCYDKCAN